MSKPIAEYTTAQWREMLEASGSVARLAQRLGVSATTTRRRLVALGIPLPKAQKRLSDEQLSSHTYPPHEWQRMYDEAGSVSELARRLNKNHGTVRYHLRRAGIVVRSEGYRSPKQKTIARGDRHFNWKGGTTMKDGYILAYAPDHPAAPAYKGYVPQHRLVMEHSLGRYLKSHELVHHKDGDKTNNRPENLELTTRSRHMQHHKGDAVRDDRGRFMDD